MCSLEDGPGVLKTMASPFAIEISPHDPSQLFETAEPSPLGNRELHPQLLEAIVEQLRNAPRGDRLCLVLRFPVGTQLQSDAICRAMREYFAWRGEADRCEIRRILRDGRFALLIGLGFMVIVNAIAELIHATFAGRLASGLVAGLEIFGWVALWRPAELLLYDWAPAYRRRRLMRRLSDATIECAADGPSKF
jgi:hypothetical protein